MALSADGETALIGAPADGERRGAAFVFTQSGEAWVQHIPKLTGLARKEEAGNGEFGAAVALSAKGDTALIGAPHDSQSKSIVGAAFVFARAGEAWSQQGPKLTGIGREEEDGGGSFGASVALSADGGTSLVGAPHDNDSLGAAFAFSRSGEAWNQQRPKLTGAGRDEEVGEGEFGASVALSGDAGTALIGAPRDNGTTGAAFVFTQAGSEWSQQGPKLAPQAEGAALAGASVALSENGNKALIGAPTEEYEDGAAWIYARSGFGWSESQRLEAPTVINPEGEEEEIVELGLRVALDADGETALVFYQAGGYEQGGVEVLVNGGAPSALTEPATEVTESTGTLNATFDPGGDLLTECWFEYGTSQAYSTTVPCSPESGIGSSPIPASKTLIKLAPNTTYHYRVSASNAKYGASHGADESFTTPASSHSGRTSSPSIPATARDRGLSVEATDGIGEVTVGHYGSDIGGPPLPRSSGDYVDVELGAGATFSSVQVSDCEVGNAARAWWYDPTQGWEEVSDQAYSPGPPACLTLTITVGTSPSLAQLGGTRFSYEPNPAPSAASAPATDVGPSAAVLNGSFTPNGPVFTECRFEYGQSTSYGSSTLCSPASGVGTSAIAASASLSQLASDSTYHYRLVASNGELSSYGADETFTTLKEPERSGTLHETVRVRTATISVSTDIRGALVTLSVPNRCVHNGLVRASLTLRIPSHKRKGSVVVKIYKVGFRIAAISRTDLRRHLSNAPFRLKVLIRRPLADTQYVLSARAFIAITHGPQRTKSLHVTLTTCP